MIALELGAKSKDGAEGVAETEFNCNGPKSQNVAIQYLWVMKWGALRDVLAIDHLMTAEESLIKIVETLDRFLWVMKWNAPLAYLAADHLMIDEESLIKIVETLDHH